jgi:hypothetical protein
MPAAPHGNRRICVKGRWPLPTVDSGALAASQPVVDGHPSNRQVATTP